MQIVCDRTVSSVQLPAPHQWARVIPPASTLDTANAAVSLMLVSDIFSVIVKATFLRSHCPNDCLVAVAGIPSHAAVQSLSVNFLFPELCEEPCIVLFRVPTKPLLTPPASDGELHVSPCVELHNSVVAVRRIPSLPECMESTSALRDVTAPHRGATAYAHVSLLTVGLRDGLLFFSVEGGPPAPTPGVEGASSSAAVTAQAPCDRLGAVRLVQVGEFSVNGGVRLLFSPPQPSNSSVENPQPRIAAPPRSASVLLRVYSRLSLRTLRLQFAPQNDQNGFPTAPAAALSVELLGRQPVSLDGSPCCLLSSRAVRRSELWDLVRGFRVPQTPGQQDPTAGGMSSRSSDARDAVSAVVSQALEAVLAPIEVVLGTPRPHHLQGSAVASSSTVDAPAKPAPKGRGGSRKRKKETEAAIAAAQQDSEADVRNAAPSTDDAPAKPAPKGRGGSRRLKKDTDTADAEVHNQSANFQYLGGELQSGGLDLPLPLIPRPGATGALAGPGPSSRTLTLLSAAACWVGRYPSLGNPCQRGPAIAFAVEEPSTTQRVIRPCILMEFILSASQLGRTVIVTPLDCLLSRSSSTFEVPLTSHLTALHNIVCSASTSECPLLCSVASGAPCPDPMQHPQPMGAGTMHLFGCSNGAVLAVFPLQDGPNRCVVLHQERGDITEESREQAVSSTDASFMSNVCISVIAPPLFSGVTNADLSSGSRSIFFGTGAGALKLLRLPAALFSPLHCRHFYRGAPCGRRGQLGRFSVDNNSTGDVCLCYHDAKATFDVQTSIVSFHRPLGTDKGLMVGLGCSAVQYSAGGSRGLHPIYAGNAVTSLEIFQPTPHSALWDCARADGIGIATDDVSRQILLISSLSGGLALLSVAV